MLPAKKTDSIFKDLTKSHSKRQRKTQFASEQEEHTD